MREILLLFLISSLLVFSSSSAFPSSLGSSSKPGIMLEEDEASSGQDFLQPQGVASSKETGMDAVGVEEFNEEVGEGLGLMERRRMIQSNDYPGAGANNHRPKASHQRLKLN